MFQEMDSPSNTWSTVLHSATVAPARYLQVSVRAVGGSGNPRALYLRILVGCAEQRPMIRWKFRMFDANPTPGTLCAPQRILSGYATSMYLLTGHVNLDRWVELVSAQFLDYKVRTFSFV